MPATNYYGEDEAAAPAAETAEPTEAESKEGTGEKQTAVINSSICPGMEVGDEMVLTIEAVRDGEYTVSYAPEPDQETPEPAAEGESEGGEGYGGPPPGRMAAMME